MNARVTVLRQLVRESLYSVDESAVAFAIIMRAGARRAVPDASFRSHGIARAGSFRRHDRAGAFRLSSEMPPPALPN